MSRRPVLLTRPRAASDRLAGILGARGWTVTTEPLLEIMALPVTLPDLSLYDSLIFTSAQGVGHFAALSPVREKPVYAVGPVTAEAARDHGFKIIRAGAGSVEALSALLAADQVTGRALHLSGVDVTGTPQAHNLTVDRLPVYEARAARALSPACLAVLDGEGFEAILFFSPRTARIFVDLCRAAGREGAVSSTKALCIADSVVESVAGIPWQDIRIAARPDGDGMTALLEDLKS